MTTERTRATQRLEVNKVWYVSAEAGARLLGMPAASMADRADLQEPGRFLIFDGLRFYRESDCRRLAGAA